MDLHFLTKHEKKELNSSSNTPMNMKLKAFLENYVFIFAPDNKMLLIFDFDRTTQDNPLKLIRKIDSNTKKIKVLAWKEANQIYFS